MSIFRFATVRIFTVVLTAFTVIALFVLSSCATSATRPTCQSLVSEKVKDAVTAGFEFRSAQPEATGELAVFVSGTSVRLYYLTPAAGVADYLIEQGWTAAGTCTGPAAKTVTVLQREVQIPIQGEKA